MVAIKFAESVVLACVGGRGLGPGASREGDKSVQRELSRSHPFLRADTLDQAGHALARQMIGWLSSGGGGGGKTSSAGTGPSLFGTQHYTILINALQSLATNRAALYSDVVPALGSALESINTKDKGVVASGNGKGGKGAGAAAGSVNVPKGLREAASSLRSACLKLLKVSPGPSKSVQRMAEAAALAGMDGEAAAAVEGNQMLRGRIRLPSRNSAPAVPPARGTKVKAESTLPSSSPSPSPPPPGMCESGRSCCLAYVGLAPFPGVHQPGRNILHGPLNPLGQRAAEVNVHQQMNSL